MGQSIRASEQGLARIDQARQRRGWTKTSTARWWQDAHTSRATLRRFWRQERIQQGAFVAICQTVGVEDWQEIAAFASTSVPPNSELPTPELPNSDLQNPVAIDWGDAPDIDRFYGRTIELAQLHRWIVGDRAKLIHIGGLGGIGKTTLAVALAEHLQGEFEGIIWRTLNALTPFETVLEELSEAPTTSLGQSIQRLFKRISQRRLLLILDVLEPSEILWDVLHNFTAARHPSCIVVVGRIPLPGQFQALNHTHVLGLSGLSVDASVQLLQSCGCGGTINQLKALARLYSYNPLALKLVSATIQTVFGGRIAPFLAQDTIVLPEPILLPLSQQLESLTPLEQSLMFWLAIWQEPIALCRVQTHLLFPHPGQVLEALSALVGRSLITRHFLADEPSFGLQPMVMAFVIEELVDAMVEEIRQAQQQNTIEPFHLLRSHCLIRPGTDDILGDRLLRQLHQAYHQSIKQPSTHPDLATMIEGWVAIAKEQDSPQMGYLIVNLTALKVAFL